MLKKIILTLMFLTATSAAADLPIAVDDETVIQPLTQPLVFDCEAMLPPTQFSDPYLKYARGFLYGNKISFSTFQTIAERDAVKVDPNISQQYPTWLNLIVKQSHDKALTYSNDDLEGSGDIATVLDIPTTLVQSPDKYSNWPFHVGFEMRDYDSDYSGPFYETHGYVVWNIYPVDYTCRLVP
jgi:hypothetical protein